MLDTSAECCGLYGDYRKTIYRPYRLEGDYRDIINDVSMSPKARALLLKMLDLPERWRVMIKWIADNWDFGTKDTVRKLFSEIIASGRMKRIPEHRADGTFEAGYYIVSAKPIFNDDGENQEFDQANSPGLENQALGIKSKENIYTTPGDCGKSTQSCQQFQAEQPQAAAKSQSTDEAEPRQSAATCLPKAERPLAAAKGSAMKGARGNFGKPVRNIERLRADLIDAGGEALADPRTTPGLWRVTEIAVWEAMGYSVEADILPAIRSVSSRHGGEAGRVRSWKYYSAAIRDWHERRTGVKRRKAERRAENPYRDPYAPPPPNPNDGRSWRRLDATALIGGRA